jgi:hypothetical protein
MLSTDKAFCFEGEDRKLVPYLTIDGAGFELSISHVPLWSVSKEKV